MGIKTYIFRNLDRTHFAIATVQAPNQFEAWTRLHEQKPDWGDTLASRIIMI